MILTLRGSRWSGLTSSRRIRRRTRACSWSLWNRAKREATSKLEHYKARWGQKTNGFATPSSGWGSSRSTFLMHVLVAALFCAVSGRLDAAAVDLPTLWAERTKCVVAVEYVTETEVARQPTAAMGTVIDENGTIILPSGAIDPRVATWQLKEFKVYLPGGATSTPGEYLGQDAFTGWHFVRAGDAIRKKVTPVTSFAAKAEGRHAPALADFVWGIGLRAKDEDFAPYILQSHVALIQSLPQRTGIAQQEVAAPGLPVFNREGILVGLAGSSGGQTFLQISRMRGALERGEERAGSSMATGNSCRCSRRAPAT